MMDFPIACQFIKGGHTSLVNTELFWLGAAFENHGTLLVRDHNEQLCFVPNY